MVYGMQDLDSYVGPISRVYLTAESRNLQYLPFGIPLSTWGD